MIALGSDHGGFTLKEHIKKHLISKGYEVKDYGTYSEESVDYPLFAKAVCEAVTGGECERGILCCGTGIGISIAANKFKGIRCALCHEPFSAKLTKEHNDANVIALGGRITGTELAGAIVDAWLGAEFMGAQHVKRIELIHSFEK